MNPKHAALLCLVVGLSFGLMIGALLPRGRTVQPEGMIELTNSLKRQADVYRAEASLWRAAVDERDAMWGKRVQELKDAAKNAELNAWKKVKAELEALKR